jgi:hypothetical protein
LFNSIQLVSELAQLWVAQANESSQNGKERLAIAIVASFGVLLAVSMTDVILREL